MKRGVSTHVAADGTYVVRLDAAFDAPTARVLDRALRKLIARGAREIVVDLVEIA
jgi:hypothetical protein